MKLLAPASRWIPVVLLSVSVPAVLGCEPDPPVGRAPPRVVCGSVDGGARDAGPRSDACAEVGVCEGSWAAVYRNGTCGADGYCEFPDPPTWDHCEVGCLSLPPYSRCMNPGPTAP